MSKVIKIKAVVFSVDIARRVNNAMYQQSTLTGLLRILLADRTNGRDIGTVLRPSVVFCTECIVAKRCVLEQKLLLRAYIIGSRI